MQPQGEATLARPTPLRRRSLRLDPTRYAPFRPPQTDPLYRPSTASTTAPPVPSRPSQHLLACQEVQPAPVRPNRKTKKFSQPLDTAHPVQSGPALPRPHFPILPPAVRPVTCSALHRPWIVDKGLDS